MSKQENRDGEVVVSKFDASNNIRVKYKDENDFNKYVKSLKTYNMLAYKDFIFNLMYQIRAGNLVGENIEDNLYRCDLQSSKIFEFVHGKTYFTYQLEDNTVTLISMEPKTFLSIGHSIELSTYKGVPITGPKDRFKVDFFLSMENNKK